jgi:hypothetical protein
MMATTLSVAVPPVEKTPREKASDLIDQAKIKMEAGLYSEALVLLEQSGQILNEITLTKSLEQTYQQTTQ